MFFLLFVTTERYKRVCASDVENSHFVLTFPAVMSHLPRQLVRRRLLRHFHLRICSRGREEKRKKRKTKINTSRRGTPTLICLLIRSSHLLCNMFEKTLCTCINLLKIIVIRSQPVKDKQKSFSGITTDAVSHSEKTG